MASEKRQLELDILANNKAAAGTAGAARDLNKVGMAADAAGHKVESLGRSSVIAGKETDKLGHDAKQTAAKVNDLDGEIKNVNRELAVMALAFHAAGSAAERMDLTKSMRKSEAEIKRITKSRNIIKGLLPDPTPEAKSFVSKLGSVLSGALSSAGTGLLGAVKGSPVISALVGAIASAAPVLAGAISAAIQSGIGAIGIGAGVFLAVKKDALLQDAGKSAGKKFIEGMSTIADKALQGPILQAIGVLVAAGQHLTTSWGAAFKSLAPFVLPLVASLSQAVTIISDSLVKSASTSGPMLAALGDSFVMIATGVGEFITKVSDGGNAADNLRLIAGALGDVISFAGDAIKWLDKLSSSPIMWVIAPWAPLLKKVYQGASDGSKQLSSATAELAVKMTAAQSAALGHRDALVALAKEMKGEADPVFGLINAEEALATAQKNAASATKLHGGNSKEARAALRELALAAIDLQDKAGGLSRTFNGRLSPAMVNTFRAAGLTDAEIAQIARQFRDAKKAGDAYARTYAAKATLTTVYKTIGGANNQTSPSIGSPIRNRRASGGPIMRGEPYLVGENGPEIVVPNAAGRVLSAAGTRGMGNVSGRAPARSGWPAGGVTAKIELVGQEEVRRMFRYMIRSMNLLETA